MIDFATIKKDFPIFKTHPELVYLDSTASSLKPQVVLDTMMDYYKNYTANIHRGLYWSSEKATEAFEQTRVETAKFITAFRSEEIIFTRNTTESINLLTNTLGYEIIKEGDEIVTSVIEHHSNFVPWQQLALQKHAIFKVIDIDEEGYLKLFNKDDQTIDESLLKQYISSRTKILALTYVSNALGTKNPITEIIKAAKKINPSIITIVDAAQAAPHLSLDVQAIGCDFLAFSSHKMVGPTGVGLLWGRYDMLNKLPPYQFGGEMIGEVTIEKTTFREVPYRFEAGTPAIGEVIGFKAAINYLQSIGLAKIHNYEIQLAKYAIEELKKTFGDSINIFGPKDIHHRGGIVTFTFGNYHPHDIAQILDEDHICIRAGHHCTMPLHTRLSLPATARASFYMYNNEEDVDKLVTSLKRIQTILK